MARRRQSFGRSGDDSHAILDQAKSNDTTADRTQVLKLISGIGANYLLAAKGDDSDAILDQAKSQNMEVVIPPKKNRKKQRHYGKEIYTLRIKTLGGERISASQALAGDCDKICKKCKIILGCSTNSMHSFMG